jgi:outer membrane protein W
MKKIINKIALIVLVFLSTSAFSQGGGYWNFQWSMGFPTGDTKDFVSKASLRGFAVEGRGFVTDQLLIGGRVAWNVFYDNLGNVTQQVNETTVVNGYSQKYLNAMPLMLTGHYEFNQTGSSVLPYIGVGLGTYYMQSRDFVGIYYVQENDWHFGFYPEVGVVIPLGGSTSNTGLNAAVQYNMAAKTKNAAAQSWIGLNIGITYIF